MAGPVEWTRLEHAVTGRGSDSSGSLPYLQSVQACEDEAVESSAFSLDGVESGSTSVLQPHVYLCNRDASLLPSAVIGSGGECQIATPTQSTVIHLAEKRKHAEESLRDLLNFRFRCFRVRTGFNRHCQ
ncbi:hypothetical protein TcWFU_000289 [Taenia crassiceps]|uniref:Uncharacterized protein n=1 Tax=Taenia crassiceps TaxID=6207 RepID=A0ABR4Q7M8_9CEST